MKRTNVIVDEELLEKARVATGERTYSGVINLALEELVRRSDRSRAFSELLALTKQGRVFRQDYVEEHYPDLVRKTREKQRVSADEARLPRRKTRRAPR